ncbi:putative ATPase [Friedmanniella endophytica]|uniref:Putative ATPase n=1 Tax=Microlunatus kandeliicorticis TaxID=1759536 RepID=A0A7W3P6M9_9ACTN|nr:AAA family ATPase [Microlunatus kandeliicorticis]MBA8795132.1 putative ATPase [Microlunatus kandeliicorticis]
MLTALAVEGYRSIRSLRVELGRVTVVTGPNGSGKSSLYRALRLLAAAGRDGAISALAREGGMPSVLWAGPEHGGRAGSVGRPQGTVRTGPVALRLGFASDVFGYAVDLGLPTPSDSMFARDPEIKVESVWQGPVLRPATLLAERRGPQVRIREQRDWREADQSLLGWESMLDEVDEPELRAVRILLRSWRFYDHVRTDEAAPARAAMVGTRTPVLAGDGADLAAALQTVREIGDAGRLDAAVDRAFPGSRVEVVERDGLFELRLRQAGLLRSLGAAELSDGTVRFLAWTAALLAPRPAGLVVLNEPETSLHRDLLPALVELVADASAHGSATATQVLVVTHAEPLSQGLADRGAVLVELEKQAGETRVAGQGSLEGPPWQWARR